MRRVLARLSRVKKRTWIIATILLAGGGVYLLLLIFAPKLPFSVSPGAVRRTLQTTKPQTNQNKLYIPAIGVDIAILEGSDASILNKGAWHRQPQNGNPEKGGNFVISAHRFELGFTPGQTRARSPFYHIEKLKIGDKIYVDYHQKRYSYEITKKYKVDQYALSIERASRSPKLTLYSCDLAGERAGREVIEAKPLDL